MQIENEAVLKNVVLDQANFQKSGNPQAFFVKSQQGAFLTHSGYAEYENKCYQAQFWGLSPQN